MIQRPFRLAGPRGADLHGDLWMAKGTPSSSAVVVVHGFKGFKDWGFFPFVCRELALAGHDVASFDFSWNGAKSGEVRNLEAFSRNTFTREIDELEEVLGRVSSGALTGKRPLRIGLLGHSRGGAISILCAADDPRVTALVTWGAVAYLDRWTPEIAESWRETGVVHVLNTRTGEQLPVSVEVLEDFHANRHRLDVRRAAASLRAPWLVVHGAEDATVPAEEGRELARLSPGATLKVLEGTGHAFDVLHPFTDSTDALERALGETVLHFLRHLQGP